MTATTRTRSPRRVFTPDSDAVYLGDNGMALCGAHLGMTAKCTGRDLSGQKIMRVVLAEVRAAGYADYTPKCERCGKVAR